MRLNLKVCDMICHKELERFLKTRDPDNNWILKKWLIKSVVVHLGGGGGGGGRVCVGIATTHIN